MRFTKMQGAGNDYVYVNCFEETVSDAPALARAISDRHFGVGSDGLILIRPSDKADFTMEMYNADGSRGKMCGNGIRCVGKFVYDNGLTDKTTVTVETLAGIKTLQLFPKDGRVDHVRVDMGRPEMEASRVPVVTDLPSVMDQPVEAGAQSFRMTCVSMGNPHCVVPVSDPDSFPVETIGPQFENLPIFPDRVNTEFIRVEDRKNIRMRVWERGSGETLACGTGACAVAVACAANGWTDPSVTVHLLGGSLQIEWDREADTVYMTGPARTVFTGDYELPAEADTAGK